MTDYTAPADRPLTELHIRDPASAPSERTTTQDAAYGRTVCDLPMFHGELWQLIDLRPGDTVCRLCADPAAVPDVQVALI